MENVINIFLPKNMTDILQVLDLIVNGVFKSLTRKLRTEVIINTFKIHKARVEAGEDVGPFICPKPSVKQAIDNFFEISRRMRANPTLK